MNDPFDPTIPSFTPRESLPPAASPWMGEYKMQHRMGPDATNAFAKSAFPAEGAGSATFSSGNESRGSFSLSMPSSGGITPHSLSSVGLNSLRANSLPFNMGNVKPGGPSLDAFNATSMTTSHLNQGNLNQSNFNYGSDSNDFRSSLNFEPMKPTTNASDRSSGNYKSGSLRSGQNNSGLLQSAWAPRALSPPHPNFSTDVTASRSKEQSTRIAEKTPSGSNARFQGQGAVPGLIPDDGQNDTFVMDTDDSPDEIVAELKLQVESLVTAIVMAKSQSGRGGTSDVMQESDGIEIAHRIMNRLKALRMENEYLGKLASGTAVAELEAKTQQLERENDLLKQKVLELQRAQGSAAGGN